MARFVLVAGMVLVQVQPGHSSDAKIENDSNSSAGGQYQLMKTEQGFVRLEKKTGEMSICTMFNEKMICRLSVDERDAYEREISRLRTELEEARSTIASRADDNQEPSEGKVAGDEPESGSKNQDMSKGADENEFEKALELSEKAMRRFFSVIQDLKKEYGSAE